MADKIEKQDSLSDELLQHFALLQFLTPYLGNQQISIIDSNNTALRGEILQFVDDNGDFKLTKGQQRKVDALRNKVLRIRGGAIDQALLKYNADMIELSHREQNYIKETIALYASIKLLKLSDAATEKLVETIPILGLTIDQIYEKLKVDDANRIVGTVVDGLQNQLSASEIDKKVFGTKASGYTDDGASDVQVTRNFVNNDNRNSGMVRTTVNGIVNASSTEMYKKSTYILGLLYVPVLDQKTSKICYDRRWNVYPFPLAPYLPAHRNCRTHYLPLIAGMSKPEEVPYDEWFYEQPATFKKEILSKKQYNQYKNGKLETNRFTNDTKKQYSFDQMYRKQ